MELELPASRIPVNGGLRTRLPCGNASHGLFSSPAGVRAAGGASHSGVNGGYWSLGVVRFRYGFSDLLNATLFERRVDVLHAGAGLASFRQWPFALSHANEFVQRLAYGDVYEPGDFARQLAVKYMLDLRDTAASSDGARGELHV